MLNPFFLNGSKAEQGLMQDLINESIRMYGIDVYYLPRQYVTERTVIKEVIESEFNFAYPIEAYVDSYDGYGGQGTILSKFGIQELDDLKIIISQERFSNYITPLMEKLPDVKLATRPKEGDLIYFPLGDRLFEIKYVEHEKPFYQLQKNYVYELTCELFRYEDEVIDTDMGFINDNIENEGYIQTIQMIGIGTTATATASIVNGGIRYITITNRGSGYTDAPKIVFSSAPPGGVTATGVAVMIGGIVDLCESDPNLFRVQQVQLTNAGAGYTVAPKITFVGGGGSGAKAQAVIGDGIVGVITVTNQGSGYSFPPPISFTGISSVGAAATAILSAAGSVSSIRITNSGLGYTSTSVQIGAPNIMIGFGTYIYNEKLTGSVSNVKARVKSWNSQTKILEVSNITGNFKPGENIVGSQSGAVYAIGSINTNNLADPLDKLNPRGKFAQNDIIEEEADEILDFSEKNPFGTP
jgi:hypothetical protein